MPVKQYLFRLYHDPISEQNRNWDDVLEDSIVLNLNQRELYYSDFICSLNEETAELSQQASMLVYAQSILTIKANTWCVAVFELNDAAGVTHQTPVIVLHPYLDRSLEPYLIDLTDGENPLPTLPLDGISEVSEGIEYQIVGGSFRSYRLYDPSRTPATNTPFPDPWMVANIARDVTSGRYQLQYVKKAIAGEDYFYSVEDTLVLNMDGSLALTRFPLWQAAVESLPQGHSGYSMDVRGKLKAQPHALTRRVLNGVTNMAQQRRMFIRRDWAINVVAKQWHETALKFLAWMWYNDKSGFPHPDFGQVYYPSEGPYVALTATGVPWDFMSRNLPWLVRFLNLVNVAQGDTGLIAALPGQTESELQTEYELLLDRLRDDSGVVRRYAVKEIGDHHTIFQHMVDLTNSIVDALVAYRIALHELDSSPEGVTTEQQITRANAYVTLKNQFALAWPGLVADFYSVFCLLMSWQLTWNVAERSRGEDATDVLRNKKLPYYPKWTLPNKPIFKRDIAAPIDMAGDFGTRRPHFVPFRTWDVSLYASGFTEALAETRAQERQEAADQWLQAQAQAQAQREQAALAARQQYITDTRAEWQRRNLPKPDDVWDYRNYTSLAWWKQKAQEPMNVEFALRAVNVPGELLSFTSLGIALARNYIPAFKKSSDASGWNESVVPAGAPVSALGIPICKILVSDTILGLSGVTPYNLGSDAAGLLADYLGTDDETYSPRQFWPPIGFHF